MALFMEAESVAYFVGEAADGLPGIVTVERAQCPASRLNQLG